MGVKIIGPDGVEHGNVGSEENLDPAYVKRVNDSFAARTEKIARQAKELYQERQKELDSITDEVLKASAAKR